MSFEKKKIVKSKHTTKRKKKPLPRKGKSFKKRSRKKKSVVLARRIRNIVLLLIVFFILSGIVSSFVLYQKYIKPLPGTQELRDLEISETSTIYDKDGNELYNVFLEKRTYVDYSKIDDNIVNALIAGEDKRYWENPGFDLIGIFRAGLYYISGKTTKVEGTSTITQQLIRNTIISAERKVERKIKEMYLSYKITKDLSKEKILELYLNKISFGGNAYGIEQAAKTFFGKSASDIDVLEASILASLPKGPSYYSPYSNPDRLLGHPYVYSKEDSENTIKIMTEKDIAVNNKIYSQLVDFIEGLKLKRLSGSKALICGLEADKVKKHISVDRDGCSVIAYSNMLVLLNGIRIEAEENVIEYQTGRKDFILQRMLEDNYIEFDAYKQSLLGSFGYKFVEYREDIKHPHFVFYVKEYLEEKYGKDLLEKGGLKIYTTLDPEFQEKAEELVEKYGAVNETKFDAKNAALISIDNPTGKILAMVGGRDYFDKDNKGNVNITTSRLQPGSSFKPFVYALAFDQQRIGTKTPIYDLETKFPGNYVPGNFDGRFEGKMTVMEALNTSRNIPAVKMFFVAGGENKIINFMKTLGVDTLGDFKREYFTNYGREYSYGASMALGTGLMTPLELASAYSVFANMGKKVEINPIEKILDSKGLVIEEFEQKDGIEVINPSLAYIMNYVLSNTGSRPSGWNTFLSMKNRSVAAKTGTSTKQYGTGDDREIFPRNLWTAGYTPQITTVVWSGNTDGKELNSKGSGLEGAGPIWKDFMEFSHKDKAVKSWERTPGIKEVDISRISGLLPPESLESSFITDALFLNPPVEYDKSSPGYSVDALCNGQVTEATPPAAIRQVSLLRFMSLRPENPQWENPVKLWVSEGKYKTEFEGLSDDVIGYASDEICERDGLLSSIELKTTTEDGDTFVKGSNFIELAYRSSNPIIRLDVFVGGESITRVPLTGKREGVYSGSFQFPKNISGATELTIRAVDSQYFSKEETRNINIIDKDKIPPEVVISEPASGENIISVNDSIRLKGYIKDRTDIKSINIYSDGNPIKIGLQGRSFNYVLQGADLGTGTHLIEVEAVDNSFNIAKKATTVEVIADETESEDTEEESEISN